MAWSINTPTINTPDAELLEGFSLAKQAFEMYLWELRNRFANVQPVPGGLEPRDSSKPMLPV